MTEAPKTSPAPGGAEAAARPAVPSASKWIGRLIIVAAWMLTAGGAGLLLDVGKQTLAPAPTPTPTPSPMVILARVQAEVIPIENSPTGYGISFNAAGYETLLSWNTAIKPAPSWADAYEAMDITLPCCGADHPFRDESQNCGCGHHQALYGAAKYLLTTDYSPAQAQAEVNRWKAYMFPKEAITAEMERRALTDPEINRALQELREKGQC